MAILAGTLLLAGPSAAELDEYQAKALFLYNFAKFVEWPPEAFKDAAEPLNICVLGATPLEQALDRTVRHKRVEGRGFTLRQVTEAKQLAGCHLLFVAGPSVRRYRTLRTEQSGLPGLLVVGETEGFATDGAVINFKLDGERLRIEINVAQAKRERLVISSRLLSMADLVGK